MDTLPSLPALRAFDAVARWMSVKRAAEELGVTPSAVSHQIARLETELGVRLFHRSNRRLLLTDTGEIYRDRVSRAFRDLRDASREVTERGAADFLVLTAPPSFAEIWLLPRLSRFLTAHPDIDLRIEATSRPVDLLRDPVDASIRYGREDWPGCEIIPLVEERLTVLCAPGLISDDTPLTSPEDLRHHTLIHSDQRLTGWPEWLRTLNMGKVKGARNLRFSQSAHSLRATVDGLGVALESKAMAADLLAAGLLCEPFPDLGPVPAGAFYDLVIPKDRAEHPKTLALKAWLIAESQNSERSPSRNGIHPQSGAAPQSPRDPDATV